MLPNPFRARVPEPIRTPLDEEVAELGARLRAVAQENDHLALRTVAARHKLETANFRMQTFVQQAMDEAAGAGS